ncbi:MAG: hypothetical protein H0X37_02740 [Herpetosiphonaceae bacterium]|nr:hypothetical protein [Herpetosiphonaceae bacterium]
MNAPQYITDAQGKALGVFLDIDTYQEMVEALEDAADRNFALDYSARKAAGQLTPDELDVIPLDQAIAESEAVWAEREQQAA